MKKGLPRVAKKSLFLIHLRPDYVHIRPDYVHIRPDYVHIRPDYVRMKITQTQCLYSLVRLWT